MALPKSFIQAWQAWQHCVAPYENSRRGRFKEPSYEIEVDLDHLDSDLYRWGYNIIGGKNFDYTKNALEELSNLSQFCQAVETLDLSQGRKELFRAYFEVTERLLNEIVNLKSSS